MIQSKSIGTDNQCNCIRYERFNTLGGSTPSYLINPNPIQRKVKKYVLPTKPYKSIYNLDRNGFVIEKKPPHYMQPQNRVYRDRSKPILNAKKQQSLPKQSINKKSKHLVQQEILENIYNLDKCTVQALCGDEMKNYEKYKKYYDVQEDELPRYHGHDNCNDDFDNCQAVEWNIHNSNIDNIGVVNVTSACSEDEAVPHTDYYAKCCNINSHCNSVFNSRLSSKHNQDSFTNFASVSLAQRPSSSYAHIRTSGTRDSTEIDDQACAKIRPSSASAAMSVTYTNKLKNGRPMKYKDYSKTFSNCNDTANNDTLSNDNATDIATLTRVSSKYISNTNYLNRDRSCTVGYQESSCVHEFEHAFEDGLDLDAVSQLGGNILDSTSYLESVPSILMNESVESKRRLGSTLDNQKGSKEDMDELQNRANVSSTESIDSNPAMDGYAGFKSRLKCDKQNSFYFSERQNNRLQMELAQPIPAAFVNPPLALNTSRKVLLSASAKSASAAIVKSLPAGLRPRSASGRYAGEPTALPVNEDASTLGTPLTSHRPASSSSVLNSKPRGSGLDRGVGIAMTLEDSVDDVDSSQSGFEHEKPDSEFSPTSKSVINNKQKGIVDLPLDDGLYACLENRALKDPIRPRSASIARVYHAHFPLTTAKIDPICSSVGIVAGVGVGKGACHMKKSSNISHQAMTPGRIIEDPNYSFISNSAVSSTVFPSQTYAEKMRSLVTQSDHQPNSSVPLHPTGSGSIAGVQNGSSAKHIRPRSGSALHMECTAFRPDRKQDDYIQSTRPFSASAIPSRTEYVQKSQPWDESSACSSNMIQVTVNKLDIETGVGIEMGNRSVCSTEATVVKNYPCYIKRDIYQKQLDSIRKLYILCNGGKWKHNEGWKVGFEDSNNRQMINTRFNEKSVIALPATEAFMPEYTPADVVVKTIKARELKLETNCLDYELISDGGSAHASVLSSPDGQRFIQDCPSWRTGQSVELDDSLAGCSITTAGYSSANQGGANASQTGHYYQTESWDDEQTLETGADVEAEMAGDMSAGFEEDDNEEECNIDTFDADNYAEECQSRLQSKPHGSVSKSNSASYSMDPSTSGYSTSSSYDAFDGIESLSSEQKQLLYGTASNDSEATPTDTSHYTALPSTNPASMISRSNRSPNSNFSIPTITPLPPRVMTYTSNGTPLDSKWHGLEVVSRNIIEINLSHNHLEGKLPDCLQHLIHLESLDLSSNRLHGNLPDYAFRSLAQLRVLSLQHNQFTGEILPLSFDCLSELREIWLGSNQFTGEIPMKLGELKKLTNICLSDNKLTGQLPDSFSALTNLQYLSVSNNNLSGEFPACIEHMTNLTELSLYKNNFSGDVPEFILHLRKLEKIQIYGNKFDNVNNYSTNCCL